MPTPPLEECADLMRAAEISIGLHVDFFLLEAQAEGGAGEEPGHALADRGGDVVVEIEMRVV